MKPFTESQERLLLCLAVFGLLVPNGFFVHQALTNYPMLAAALSNPVALVFNAEAIFLMGLFAWLVQRNARGRWNWVWFILLSLVGSLFFSVPLFLYFASSGARTASVPG